MLLSKRGGKGARVRMATLNDEQPPLRAAPGKEMDPDATTFPSLCEAVRAQSVPGTLHWCRRLTSAVNPSLADAINAKDDSGRTAFHWSVALGAAELVRQLPEEPYCADLMTYDATGVTTLTSAIAARADEAIIFRLIDMGASRLDWLNKADDTSGNTALMAAVSRGLRGVVGRLLGAGADPLIANRQGQTPLHRAVSKGNLELVEDLIFAVRKSRDAAAVKKMVNAQDANGDTSLHYAAMENNKEIGSFLLRNGADRTIQNRQGKEFWQC